MSSDRDDIAIRVNNISKCFDIYENPRNRLKQFIFPRLQRLLGRPIKKYYREFWALKDVSFEVKKGETYAVVGRNGSGKSTLLQVICGTLNPTSGTIQTNGRVAALLELGSGFNPEFTGRENVYLNASVLGLSHHEIETRFDAITAFADIGDFIEQPVKTYSSGMMVRLAFAVIAHVDADILVIDEALAVGDAFFTQKCMRYLRGFMENGTVLFVSHDTGAVVNLCSQAVFLQKGQIIAQGIPKDIVTQYLATLYAESQKMDGAKNEGVIAKKISHDRKFETTTRDMRDAMFNGSTLRNDIEVFNFDPNKNFGTGGAQISSVRILDTEGAPLTWIVGGEEVILEITCLALTDIRQPIVGFQFKDRLGQIIFNDNTYLVYKDNPEFIPNGSEFVAQFEFCLPRLPTGDYSFSPAVADGTQSEHVQLQWLHDALVIKVHATPVCLGLIGLPMKNIKLEKVE
jgi:lipopolysaccharide transport system ATP-binding protein